MKRILVLSDTHHNIGRVIDLLSSDHRFNHIIHLGDNVSDAEDIESITSIGMTKVKGNCDPHNQGVHNDAVVEIDGIKIFATHGHLYNVKASTQLLKNMLDQTFYDVVLFGHSHRGWIEYYKNSVLLNPGSISLPRDGQPSFGVITIDDEKNVHVNIARIK